MPEHKPSQLLNAQPFTVLLAVSVTTVPCGKFALHVVGQSIPAGLLVTFPLPLMLTDKDEVGGGGGGPCVVVKTAVTDSFPLTAKVQVGGIEAFPCTCFEFLAFAPCVLQAPL